MTGHSQQPNRRLSQEIQHVHHESMATPIPAFRALEHKPAYLGLQAHLRLEEILGIPVASDDANPEQGSDATGQKAGVPLGDIVGREPDFTKNYLNTKDKVALLAQDRDVSEQHIWDELTEVVMGSGIDQPMHRTLARHVGGAYGARSFVDDRRQTGITVVLRENIANWGARRHDQLTAFLGSLPGRALDSVELVIYAGGPRVCDAPNEIWRPELQPFVKTKAEQKTTAITESGVADLIHAPQTKRILDARSLDIPVSVVAVDKRADGKNVNGDDVTQAIIDAHGNTLRDTLIVEIGNAPAGYTQMDSGLLIADKLGIDPNEQFLAISDGVNMVHPDHFAALSIPERSKVQNVLTGLNSINGWLRSVVRVNEFEDRRPGTI